MPDIEFEAPKPADSKDQAQPLGGGLVGLSGDRKTSTSIGGVTVDFPFLHSRESYSLTMGLGTVAGVMFQSKYRSFHQADFAANLAGGFSETGMSMKTLRAGAKELGPAMIATIGNYALDKTVFADTERTWRSVALDVASLGALALPRISMPVKLSLMIGAHVGGRIWDGTVPPEPPPQRTAPAPPKAFEFNSDRYLK